MLKSKQLEIITFDKEEYTFKAEAGKVILSHSYHEIELDHGDVLEFINVLAELYKNIAPVVEDEDEDESGLIEDPEVTPTIESLQRLADSSNELAERFGIKARTIVVDPSESAEDVADKIIALIHPKDAVQEEESKEE